MTNARFRFTIIYNMLTVRFEQEERAARAYEELGLSEPVRGANFVMYDGVAPAALMRMSVRAGEVPTATVDKILFKDGLDEGDKKFFLHAMFFKLREGSPIKLRLDFFDSDYLVFGFEERDGGMEIFSGDINLYYNCGGRRNG